MTEGLSAGLSALHDLSEPYSNPEGSCCSRCAHFADEESQAAGAVCTVMIPAQLCLAGRHLLPVGLK